MLRLENWLDRTEKNSLYPQALGLGVKAGVKRSHSQILLEVDCWSKLSALGKHMTASAVLKADYLRKTVGERLVTNCRTSFCKTDKQQALKQGKRETRAEGMAGAGDVRSTKLHD